jgi:hypothetical protein
MLMVVRLHDLLPCNDPILAGLPVLVSSFAGIVLMLMVVRLMWSLTAQRRLSVITRTITQVQLAFMCSFGSGFTA